MTRPRTTFFLAMLAATSLSLGSADAGSTWHVGPKLVDKPKTYALLMVKADKAAIAAAQYARMRRTRTAWRYARQAVALYERAIKAKPKQAEPHFRAATIIHAHWFSSIDHCGRRRSLCKQMVQHWHAFEQLAPLDPRTSGFLFSRALAYTTLAEKRYYRKAVADYERLINSTRFASMGGDRATTLGNLAEVYMMLTDIDRAIPVYKRAIAEGDQALHAYGLAVALDRDGRGSKAREVMRRYSQGDIDQSTGELKQLTRTGVFFVPNGEIHYYHALGFEAQGNLGKAIIHYQKFVRSGAHPKFQTRAKENLKRLRKQLLSQFRKHPPMISPVLP